jgi:MFS transporter, DHA1 family, inner membrane transport protein
MWQHAYHAQCTAVDERSPDRGRHPASALTLFSLAFGSFCIGTSEFASMGVLQLFAPDLGTDVSTATNAIAAYALGVVVGAPVITLAAARVHRRTLLLALIALFVVGNIASAASTDLGVFAVARFISGLPQGAYFGAAAVVATHVVGRDRTGKAFAMVMLGITVATVVGSPLGTLIGQNLGWRHTYVAVAVLALGALVCLITWVPRSDELRGGSLSTEVGALRKRAVWVMIVVAALGVSSIFAVYTFIGPLTTELAGLPEGVVPVALALFGIGMTAGNLLGGRLADRDPRRGIATGFGSALVVLAVLATAGGNAAVLLASFPLIGLFMMTAIPAIQVELTGAAPDSPTLMGAMNLAALNVANALGAWCGGLAVAGGRGLLATAWAGFALTAGGLVLYLAHVRRRAAARATSHT